MSWAACQECSGHYRMERSLSSCEYLFPFYGKQDSEGLSKLPEASLSALCVRVRVRARARACGRSRHY